MLLELIQFVRKRERYLDGAQLIRQRVAEESGEGADLSLAVEQQQRAEARADED